MRDMLLALDLVRDNIENFGGNPDLVTLFGQSGGGGKVSVLTAMPNAQGRYHRGIIMSGSTLEVETADAATETTERFIAGTGAGDIDALQRMPWEKLNAEADRLAFRMGPTVDGTTLPAQPYSPAAPAMSADVPLIIGTTEYEAIFFPDTPLDPIDDATLRKLVSNQTGADDAGIEELIATYRRGRPGVGNVDIYQTLRSDFMFGAAAQTQAARKAALGAGAVYKYYFTWKSPVREGKLKSCHCMDIPFAFNNVDLAASMVGAGQDRYALADQISGAFAQFARTGDPNHSGLPEWPVFTADRRATMVFNDESSVVDDPHGAERRAIAEILASS
jgi:para-nitrobenzyl esterase